MRPNWVFTVHEEDQLLKHVVKAVRLRSVSLMHYVNSHVAHPQLPAPTTKSASLLLASVEAISKLGPWLGLELWSSGLGFGRYGQTVMYTVSQKKEARGSRFLSPAEIWKNYT